MSTKLTQEKAMYISELEQILSACETRAMKDTEVERATELRQLIETIDENLKQTKRTKRERGTNIMEIRELLANGQELEVRAGEVTNANIGTEKVEFLGGVIDKVADISPLFARANKINTTSTSALTVQGTKLPKFVKVAELQEYTKAQATFDEKVLKADKYGLVVIISEECLEDAGFDLEGEISKQMIEGLGLALNEMVANKLATAEGANKVTAELSVDGLIDMYYGLKAPYRNGAVWVINPEMEIAIAKLKDTTGQPIMVRAYADRPVMTIMGCEVIVDENVTVPMFVNLAKALTVGVRHNINIKRDDSVGFLSGTVAFRADARMDAVTTVEEAIVIGQVTGVRAKK